MLRPRTTLIASGLALLCGASIAGTAQARPLGTGDDPSSPPASALPGDAATSTPTPTPTIGDPVDVVAVEATAAAAMTAEVKAGATDENVADASDSTQLQHDQSASENSDRITELRRYEVSDLADKQAAALRAAYPQDLAFDSQTQDQLIYTDGTFEVDSFPSVAVSGDSAQLVMTGHATYDTVSGDTTSGTPSTYTVTLRPIPPVPKDGSL